MSVKSSTRSISMSPESARPVTAGVDAGLPAVAQLGGGRASRSAKDLTMPSTWSTSSPRGWPSSRTAWWAAAARGLRSRWSGRASNLPVPQLARTAELRRALSSTVLPTPRRPVSTIDRGAAARDPLEHDVEGAQLLVATGELGQALTRAGGVRVRDRVHDQAIRVSTENLRHPDRGRSARRPHPFRCRLRIRTVRVNSPRGHHRKAPPWLQRTAGSPWPHRLHRSSCSSRSRPPSPGTPTPCSTAG